MLDTQEIATYLTEKLNTLGGGVYKFNIVAEVGKAQANDIINGIIKMASGTPTNIAGYTEIEYNYNVEIVVPSAMANNNVLNIMQIICDLVREINDTEVVFKKGVATLTLNLGKSERYQTTSNSGNNVPIYFGITALYTESSITSTNKKWYLNDFEIPYLNENVLLDKEGNTNKINGEKYSKTILTGQTKRYKFIFPYKDNELCNMLQMDILQGNFDKQYVLKYIDGKIYTEENPYVTTVSIYQNADTSSQRAKVSMFNLSFIDADNGQDDIKYSIALIDTPFDNQSEDTRWFINSVEQEVYFNEKAEQGAYWEFIKAPNLESLNLTNQVYENNRGYDFNSLINKNYAIIRRQSLINTVYYYYFVESCQIGQNNQVMYNLRLDSVQTYMFKQGFTFGDCFIEKACLNRFIQDETDAQKVKFDGTVNSKLFEREDIQNVSKRLISRDVLPVTSFISNDTQIKQWLKDNVMGWVYFVLDGYHSFCYVGCNDGIKQYKKFIKLAYNNKDNNININNNTSIPNKVSVVAVPVMKNNKTIIFKAISGDITYKIKTNILSIIYFEDLNGSAEPVEVGDTYIYNYVYKIIFSEFPPINIDSGIINSDGDLEINTNFFSDAGVLEDYNGGFRVYSTNYRSSINNYGIISLLIQQNELIENYTINNIEYSFNKDEIINADKNVKYNPKLLSADYKSLVLSDTTQNGFEYDLQKLNTNNVKIYYTEPLTPEIQKKYIRLTNLTEDNPFYSKDTTKNYLGFVNSNDNSLTISKTAYGTMMANNKNYSIQAETNRRFALLNSAIGIGTNILTGNLSGALLGTINADINYIQSRVNQNLTIDNVKNAPSSVSLAGNNVVLNSMVSEMGVVVEQYDILPNEKEIINDYMVKYGFNVNRIGKIKDYLNIRKNFNYIKARIDNISGIAISNTARADIRQRFANGIRFWNSDNINYDKENYEIWLED